MRELLDAFKPKGEGTAMKLMQFARHLCSISLHPKARFHGNGIMYRAAALRETLNTRYARYIRSSMLVNLHDLLLLMHTEQNKIG